VAATAPAVNHHLFADDSLLFLKASEEGAQEINNLLLKYCNASRQRVNLDKSSVFFSKGCPEGKRQAMKNIRNVPNETMNEKYLGMPSDIGRSTNGAFKYLKYRIWEHIQGWLEKTMAARGKEFLIKSMAQAIPTFSMYCFKLPRGLCLAINAMLRNFCWGSKNGKRKPSWVSWEKMCSPKFSGGMSFWDIELFNLVMLARQAWRILHQEALISRVLKAIYFHNTDFLQATMSSSPSHVWRAIVEGKEVMKQGLVHRIGTWEDTDPWNDNWLPRDYMLCRLKCLVENPPAKVADLIDSTTAT
jgi:hypothetical protein